MKHALQVVWNAPSLWPMHFYMPEDRRFAYPFLLVAAAASIVHALGKADAGTRFLLAVGALVTLILALADAPLLVVLASAPVSAGAKLLAAAPLAACTGFVLALLRDARAARRPA
jgi:hypothetical protein